MISKSNRAFKHLSLGRADSQELQVLPISLGEAVIKMAKQEDSL